MSWTGALPLAETDIRTYLEISGTSGKYSTASIGSNIRAAAGFLQHETQRQFEQQSATKTFTTNGKPFITIPDVRAVTSVTLQSSALTADAGYWLVPDAHHQGVYTGVQFRAFGRGGYRSNPEWFDRNLDVYESRGYDYTSLPNDLVIVSTQWGWDPYPSEFLHAVKVLAGFYTLRPSSVLANVQITPEGNELRYSQLPIEVSEFISGWMVGDQVAVIG